MVSRIFNLAILPQHGFDDLGLYLFATKEEAESFVAASYR